MKIIYTLLAVALIAVMATSCVKHVVAPANNTGKSDTSTTLITSKTLIGNWNIVTDTISFNGNNIMYHGTPADHYNFTKYGNLYINEGLQSYVDTAVYAITSITNTVQWVNTYSSSNGVATRNQSLTGPFTISSVDSVKLVLTSTISTAVGPRYEQIVFKK